MKFKIKTIALIATFLAAFSFSYGQEEKKEEKPYNGLELKVNDNWKIKFSGQVNTYFVSTFQKEDKENGVEAETFSSIRNGLSQATLSAEPQYTFADGTVVKGTFGLAFGLSNSGSEAQHGQSRGFGYAPMEIRQASVRIITPKSGSILIGRDFGIFGVDAIINDLSFFGVGANYSYSTGRNTTLGGIGYGYIFVDKLAQIDYTTPNFFDNTSNLTLGVYAPFGTFDTYGAFGDAFQFTNSPNEIGVHGKFSFNKAIGKKSNVYLSSSFISQSVGDNNTDANLKGFGIDAFLKFNVNKNLTLAGYYYSADGIGDAGIMFGPAINLGDAPQTVETNGYYAQATYAFSKTPITLGLHYGASQVKDKVVDDKLEFSDSATRWTNSISYAFKPNLILKSEYTIQGRHKIFAPEADVFSLGGVFFF